MLYQSTRNENITADSIQAVLQGPAPDGGLYIDGALDSRPFDWQSCLSLPPLGVANAVLSHLLPDFEDMQGLVKAAYEGKFRSEKLTPLVPVGEDFVLELFHGPTCAFKDVALSMLPRLITAARRQTGAAGKTLILTATSGDTGKAALEGFHDVEGTGIIVFYPADRVSPIQQAQMVTQAGSNVKVCALRGNFDDCQRGVKEAFLKLPESGILEAAGCALSSANSINIGRLAPQVAYYFLAYSQLLDFGRIKMGEEVDFVVPTGNFGDILAGYYARMMGLPVGRLVCASNANRVLTDFSKPAYTTGGASFIKPPLPRWIFSSPPILSGCSSSPPEVTRPSCAAAWRICPRRAATSLMTTSCRVYGGSFPLTAAMRLRRKPPSPASLVSWATSATRIQPLPSPERSSIRRSGRAMPRWSFSPPPPHISSRVPCWTPLAAVSPETILTAWRSFRA